jgi:hypothetical protein
MPADRGEEPEPSMQSAATGGPHPRTEESTPRSLVEQAIDKLDHGEPGAAKRILLRLLQEI